MKRETISIEKAVELMDSGKIFTAFFLKRTTNKMRSMNARCKVNKGVTGKGLSFNPAEKNLKVVYEIPEEHHKTIDLRGLVVLKAKGKTFLISPRPEGILL